MLRLLVVIAILGVSGVAAAHPGHGQTSADSLWHYLSEPVHLFLLVAGAVAGWMSLRFFRQQRRRRLRR